MSIPQPSTSFLLNSGKRLYVYCTGLWLGTWKTAWVRGRGYTTAYQTASEYITRSTRPSRFFSCTLKNMGRPGYKARSDLVSRFHSNELKGVVQSERVIQSFSANFEWSLLTETKSDPNRSTVYTSTTTMWGIGYLNPVAEVNHLIFLSVNFKWAGKGWIKKKPWKLHEE